MEKDTQIISVGMHSSPTSGGLDRYFHSLGEAFLQSGKPIEGFVFDQGEKVDSDWLVSLGPVKRSLISRLRQIRASVRKALPKQRPVVIASHFALYALPICYGISGVRHVIHFQGPWASESEAEGASKLSILIKYAVERLVYRRAHRLMVLSESFRDILIEKYGICKSRITVLAAGVEVDRFSSLLTRAEARRRLGWREDGFNIVCVRRLTPRMGLENLIEAVAKVVKQHPQVRLFIAGRGPLTAELQTKCQVLGIENHVTLMGFVSDEDLPIFYRAADMSIVPSVALEGFGLVTLESLACGTPVMVTPVGGLPGTIRDFTPNLILKSSDISALEGGIRDVVSGVLPLPSAAACRQYAEGFAWPLVAARVRAVYDEVLAEKK